MPVGGFLSALGSLGSTMINVGYQSAANAQNVAMQKEVNEWQKHFATNAYQIAARDKMIAGLSPLETSPAQAPTLTSPQVQAPQVHDLGQAIAQGMAVDNSRQLNASSINANNAQAVKTAAESADILAKLEDYNTTREARLQALIANYNNTRDKGSLEAQQMSKQIDIMKKSIDKQNEEINNLRLKNGELSYNINWYSSLGLPVDGPITKESLAAALGKRLGEEKNAKESNAVIEADQKRQEAVVRKQIDEKNRLLYADYVSQYEQKKKQLDQLVYEKKLSAKEAKAQLGSLLPFGSWRKRYGY